MYSYRKVVRIDAEYFEARSVKRRKIRRIKKILKVVLFVFVFGWWVAYALWRGYE